MLTDVAERREHSLLWLWRTLLVAVSTTDVVARVVKDACQHLDLRLGSDTAQELRPAVSHGHGDVPDGPGHLDLCHRIGYGGVCHASPSRRVGFTVLIQSLVAVGLHLVGHRLQTIRSGFLGLFAGMLDLLGLGHVALAQRHELLGGFAVVEHEASR